MELEVVWTGKVEQWIGRLYQDGRGLVFFEYDALWKTGRRELSPLYLPNETIGAVTTQSTRCWKPWQVGAGTRRTTIYQSPLPRWPANSMD